jgi:pimeloyl-ACP methyl ester carboxylesterase
MVKFNLEHVFHRPEEVTESRITRYADCYRGKGTIRALLTTARQVDRISKPYDHRDISVPTLIIWGRHDRVVLLQNGQRLNNEIAGSHLVVFDCGHNPHEEEAAACSAAIISFLEAPA